MTTPRRTAGPAGLVDTWLSKARVRSSHSTKQAAMDEALRLSAVEDLYIYRVREHEGRWWVYAEAAS